MGIPIDIKCPNCQGDDFVIMNIGKAQIEDGIIASKDIKLGLMCTGAACGYAISNESDLHLQEIDIYLTGNSISGIRQGLVRATELRGEKLAMMLSELSKNKFINFGEKKTKWAVTTDMWEAYNQGTSKIPFPNGVKFNVKQ